MAPKKKVEVKKDEPDVKKESTVKEEKRVVVKKEIVEQEAEVYDDIYPKIAPSSSGIAQNSFVPPEGWEDLYLGIRSARKTIGAPVDTIGCHVLKDPLASKEDGRYQTLLSLMLSAQTRDQCTAQAMRQLIAFNKCTVKSMADTDEETIKGLISCVCFYNNKARYIKKVTTILNDEHNGIVPSDYKTLVSMPGLGPKMVHLFLQTDGKVEGIGVDVHVHRLAQRFGWVPSETGASRPTRKFPAVKTAEDTRRCLETWLPRQYWPEINVMLVGYGQALCTALNPKCDSCTVNHLCPNAFKECKSSTKSAAVSPPSTPRVKGAKTVRSVSAADKDSEQKSPNGARGAVVDMEELCGALQCKRGGRRNKT